MQYFYIKQNSELPLLRMELVNDGKYDFMKYRIFNNSIQNATVTFSMRDEEGVLKISNAECSVYMSTEGGCEDKFIIEYKWQKRDTKNKGQFEGEFKIDFLGDLYEDGVDHPNGLLIMPIYEKLTIFII